jgi:hypothetical protein
MWRYVAAKIMGIYTTLPKLIFLKQIFEAKVVFRQVMMITIKEVVFGLMTSMREVEDPKKSGLDKIRRKNLVLMTESNVLLVKDAKN